MSKIKNANADQKIKSNKFSEKKETRVVFSREVVKHSTMNITVLAMLTALLVVLSLFCTIKTEALKITLAFIPVMIAAKLYGAWGAAMVAGLGDIIGYICYPTGPWFPPITVTAIITGIIFGIFLKDNSFKTFKERTKAVIAVVIAQLIISAFVTPLWLNILYKTSYMTFFVTRIPQIAVMTAIQLIFIPIMIKTIDTIAKLRLFAMTKLDSVSLPEKNQDIKKDN